MPKNTRKKLSHILGPHPPPPILISSNSPPALSILIFGEPPPPYFSNVITLSDEYPMISTQNLKPQKLVKKLTSRQIFYESTPSPW